MGSTSVFIPAVALVCAVTLVGSATPRDGGRHPRRAINSQKTTAVSPAFSLAIVNGREGITMAEKNPDDFYLVLTNISEQSQKVWEDRNSWGYYAISFEMTTADGKKFAITRRPIEFTKNAPSTFLVEPGEHQVCLIRLDRWWETHPALPKANEMPIRPESDLPSASNARGRAVQSLDRTPRISQLEIRAATMVNSRLSGVQSVGKPATGHSV